MPHPKVQFQHERHQLLRDLAKATKEQVDQHPEDPEIPYPDSEPSTAVIHLEPPK